MDSTATAPSAPVRALTAAVDALLAQVPADMPGPQALTDATALVAELERLRSLVLTRVADVDTRKLHTLSDQPSTGTWLAAQQTSLTRTELAFARRLAAFPTVAAAVDTGALSVAVAARRRSTRARRRRAVPGPLRPRPAGARGRPGRGRRPHGPGVAVAGLQDPECRMGT